MNKTYVLFANSDGTHRIEESPVYDMFEHEGIQFAVVNEGSTERLLPDVYTTVHLDSGYRADLYRSDNPESAKKQSLGFMRLLLNREKTIRVTSHALRELRGAIDQILTDHNKIQF
jgi:hypothetical protein